MNSWRTTLLILFSAFAVNVYSQDFDRPSFYAAMASDNVTHIDKQLEIVSKSSITGKEAYEGALTMKKAGLIKGPGKKLSLFKAGHKKLEAALNKDADNAEYHFLRLMIQENAPGILGYKDDLEKDKTIVIKQFKSLPAPVQQAVTDYSKKSKVIKPADL
jgi:hypothetical protein